MDHQANRRRLSRMLWLAVLAGVLITSGCGSDDGDSTAGDGTGTSTSQTSTSPPSSSSSDTTAPASTGTSPTTAATTAPGTPTVADLEQALKDEIEATYPTGPGVVQCEASGELTDWQPVLCSFIPDEPAEFGGIHVSMLDDGRYAWDIGECCGAAPWPEAYPSGLLCRDLIEPPPGTTPDQYPPDTDHLTYGLAVYYWLTENRPDRMDEDLNGRPCETVYPTEDATTFWDSVRTL